MTMIHSGVINRAEIYLSLFSQEQIKEITSYVLANGSATPVAIQSARKRNNLPPAILIPMDRQFVSSDEKALHLAHGLCTILFAASRQSWGFNQYKNLMQVSFGLSDAYASQLASLVNTEDLITGFGANVSDKLKRLWNFLVPEAIEIADDPSVDLDFIYEFSRLGKVVIELMERMKLTNAAAMFALGDGAVAKAETGDYSTLIGDLQIAAHAAQPIHIPDNELGDLWGAIKKGVSSVGKAVKGIVTSPIGQAAAMLVPGLSLPVRAAMMAAPLVLGGGGKPSIQQAAATTSLGTQYNPNNVRPDFDPLNQKPSNPDEKAVYLAFWQERKAQQQAQMAAKQAGGAIPSLPTTGYMTPGFNPSAPAPVSIDPNAQRYYQGTASAPSPEPDLFSLFGTVTSPDEALRRLAILLGRQDWLQTAQTVQQAAPIQYAPAPSTDPGYNMFLPSSQSSPMVSQYNEYSYGVPERQQYAYSSPDLQAMFW